jgi:hypothetical protein
MIVRSLVEFQTLSLAAGPGAVLTGIIKQQRRRLESVGIVVTQNAANTPTGPTADSWARLVSRIQIRINDAFGSRDLVDVNGASVLKEYQYLGGTHPAQTQFFIANTATVAVTPEICYRVDLRHPQLEEPAGNLTSIPLYQLNEDMQVIVTMGANLDIASSGVTVGATVRMVLIYRDTVAGEYIGGEVKTIGAALPTNTGIVAAGTSIIEIASNGVLSSLLMEGFTSATGLVTGSLLASGDSSMSFYYGREVLRKIHDSVSRFLSGPLPGVGGVNVGGGFSALVNRPGEYFLDFADDQPMINAFSMASAVNLTGIVRGGDTARLELNPTAGSTPFYRLTTRRFIGGPLEKLLAV